MSQSDGVIDVTVVLPCLNERDAVGLVLGLQTFAAFGVVARFVRASEARDLPATSSAS